MNTTTTITLNDRFSMMKKSNGFQQQPQRGRSRSQSRNRQQQQQPQELRGSRRNRKLLDQLEKQHKMRLALKLKNKSIVRSRGRMQGQIVRNGAKRAAAIKKAVNVRNLKRANSLTTFVPLNDGPRRNMRGRSRSRSQSRNNNNTNNRSRSQSRNRNQQTGSVIDRLGIRSPRGRMRRGAANNRGPANNGAQQQQRGRSRSRSRVRLNRNNFNNNNRNNANNQSQMRRSNSVNARLGQAAPAQIRRRPRFASNTRNANTQLNKPIGGRIVKRTQRNPVGTRIQRNVRKNGPILGINNARRGGKTFKRGAGNARGQARGRAGNRGATGQMKQGAQGGNARRGRSRTRRGNNTGRGGGAGGIGRGQISKDALDKQLDDYMSKGSA